MPTSAPDQSVTQDRVESALIRWLELVEDGHAVDLDDLTRGMTEPERAEFEARRGRLESARAHLEGMAGPPPDRPEPTGLAGRYIDLVWHAAGGMGDVYRARDVELGRVVAYKVMRPRHGDEGRVRNRFAREAEVTAMLQSPGVVPVYGLVADGSGLPAYAMEFVDGPTLRDKILAFHRDFPAAAAGRKESPPRREARLGLLRHVLAACRIVAHAHAHAPAYVHCDLKPNNIMVDARGATRVLDWGLARPIADGTTEAGGFGGGSGTPGYIAPSLLAGGRLTTACDVYSLGATLAAVACGLTPEGPPDLARLDGRDVPRPLRAIVRAAMADHAEPLYPTAAALADDLQRHLEGGRVVADCEPLSERAWRLISRHKAATAGGIVSILVAVLAIAAVAWIKYGVERGYREDSLKNLSHAYITNSEKNFSLSRDFTVVDRAQEMVRTLLTIHESRDQDPDAFPKAASGIITLFDQSKRAQEEEAKVEFRASVDSMWKAIEVLETLDREFPGRRKYRLSLGRCYCALAMLQMNGDSSISVAKIAASMANPGKAGPERDELESRLALIDKSIAMLPPVDEDDLKDWTGAWLARSELLIQLGRFTESLLALEEYLKLANEAKTSAIRWTRPLLRKAAEIEQSHMPWSHGPDADHARAIRLADSLAAQEGVSPAARFNVACVYAQASLDAKADAAERERRAGRAVSLLERIARDGHFRGFKPAGDLRNDPDLSPLRSRADFQAFVARVATAK